MAREAHYKSSDYHRAGPDGQSVPKRRPDKTVCHERDGRHPDAGRLLKMGFRRGMVSTRQRNDWPRNVWAVDSNGVAYEGMLTNQGNGQYHGYPMVPKLRFTKHIVAQWSMRT